MSLPVDLDRDEARELAQRELSHPRYDPDPSLLQQAAEWVLEKVGELLSRAGGTLSGPAGGVLLALIAAVVAVLLLRYGPLARQRRATPDDVLGGTRRSAREYRAAADAAAAAGDWSEAVVERFRAITVDLHERSIIDVRPGVTADEAAWNAGLVLPELADRLSAAATLFDSVHYGGHGATSADDRRLRELDEAARRTRARLEETAQAAHR
jgi:hypothetical protein